jgi:hypothetical protein
MWWSVYSRTPAYTSIWRRSTGLSASGMSSHAGISLWRAVSWQSGGLEASADDLGCPDFGLRLSQWQGLDILGPIAVIARNAQTLLGALEAIAQYLYVHSPALRLTAAPRTTEARVKFTYEVTEPGLPYILQGYELSMAIGVRIIRLLGGPEARPHT